MSTRTPLQLVTTSDEVWARDVLDASSVTQPAFLMCPPLSYATDVANNAWMQELSDEERVPDRRLALVQFFQVYRFIASEALVYLLPTPRTPRLQDQVFSANLGVVLEHLERKDTVVISNFASEPRREEAPVGTAFFEAMGYDVHVAPAHFEGDAELKHLHGNVYVGGYGIRSARESYHWMERTFDMKVIGVELTDPYLYHLDCLVFPLTREKTMVCTELLKDSEVKALEEETEIVEVSADDAFSGICNSVRVANTILNASHIHELQTGTEDYSHELKKNRRLEDIASELALEVNYFNLSEYHKGGALLSCMVMHLNRFSYGFQLT